VAGDHVEALEVDVLEAQAVADVVVEERQLAVQLAQRLLDGGDRAPPATGRARVPC
jgi:hypothetical protein